jgi:cysteine desulfurase
VRIYLDHNATTPADPAVADAMAGVLRGEFGNPSSVHYFGQQAKARLDAARASVAGLVGADPSEIIFTSVGTEADVLALRGAAEALESTGKRHFVTTPIEHEAILQTAKALTRRGWQVTLLEVGRSGVVDPGALETALGPETSLVSVMHANNEIGTVQPIETLASLARARGALFHTDAVQSAGKMAVDVRKLGVDMLSLSAHKFHGPKGIGALFVRRGTRLVAQATGGRQERNRRAGTENVPAIVGAGVAADLARKRMAHAPDTAALRDRLERGILERVPGTTVNGARDARVPNTSNIGFDGVEAESLLIALDLEGVAVSTGSACSSGTLEPSHVLKAMGLPLQQTTNAIRFSLGHGNTEAEIDRVLEVLPAIVARLRQVTAGVATRG